MGSKLGVPQRWFMHSSYKVTPFRACIALCALWGVWTVVTHMTHQPSLKLHIHMTTPVPDSAKALAPSMKHVESTSAAALRKREPNKVSTGAEIHQPLLVGDIQPSLPAVLPEQQAAFPPSSLNGPDGEESDSDSKHMKSHKEAIQSAVWNRFRHAVHPSVDGGASRARLSRSYAFFNYTTVSDLPRRPIQCIGWKQTSDCSPYGHREPDHDLGCNEQIPPGSSGYCNMWDKRYEPRGELKRVMLMHCSSHPNYALTTGNITCGQAAEFAMFSQDSVAYRPPNSLQEISLNDTHRAPTQGIVFCVAEGLMVSAYASIRLLRAQGCELPIEIWYLPDELNITNPIATDLVENYGVEMRHIDMDRSQLCHGGGKEKCFNTKIHAVYNSRWVSAIEVTCCCGSQLARDKSHCLIHGPSGGNASKTGVSAKASRNERVHTKGAGSCLAGFCLAVFMSASQ